MGARFPSRIHRRLRPPARIAFAEPKFIEDEKPVPPVWCDALRGGMPRLRPFPEALLLLLAACGP
ncbi:MAG: hypothetical protein KGK11_00005, partial [Sphingomonadales bacterium]|nr:hypothetical protein [Sphingomonadales bacterium]